MQGAQTTFRIVGAVTGDLWMGGEAWKEISFDFAREGRPFVSEADTLAEAVDVMLTREGGDFANDPKLTGDSVLIVTRRNGTREHKRFFDVTALRSIADRVAADVYVPIEAYG